MYTNLVLKMTRYLGSDEIQAEFLVMQFKMY